jgi:uncharacterized protein (DUF2147 family)
MPRAGGGLSSRTTISKTGLAAGVVLWLATSGFAIGAPATPEGLWRTRDFSGLVEIYGCGAELCGRLVTSDILRDHPDLTDLKNPNPSLRMRPLIGLVVLRAFKGGPTRWEGGRIYRPLDGSTFSGSITLTADDRLVLKGCLFIPVCKSQIWTRYR